MSAFCEWKAHQTNNVSKHSVGDVSVLWMRKSASRTMSAFCGHDNINETTKISHSTKSTPPDAT
jgi:hypothetical protein